MEKELKIIELKEKLEKLKQYEKNCFKIRKIFDNEIVKKQNNKENVNKQKDEKFFYESLIKDNEEKIENLKNQKDKLLEKVKKINKIIRQLKFDPPLSGKNFLYRILQKDLIDYDKYITYLINKRKYKIEEIINKIKMIINEIFPHYELKIYGSYSYGLFFPWSDINLILVNKNFSFNNENKKEENLSNSKDIEKAIGEKSISNENETQTEKSSTTQEFDNDEKKIKEEENLFTKLKYVFQEYNWITKIETKKIYNINTIHFIIDVNSEKIEINISINNENHNGLKVVELIKSFMKDYPELKPLTLALGAILKNADLNKQLEGGLPLYGLILMIVSYIQSKKNYNNISEENQYKLAKIFYDFLNEKGNKLNISQNGQELIIVDPLDKNNNVAKLTYQFMNIKMSLLIAFMTINEECECGCHYGSAPIAYSIERSFLKRIFNSVKRF